MFTLYDVTVSADTTFTATYGTVSDSIVVEYCTMVDYGVTNNNNLIQWYYAPSYSSASVDAIKQAVDDGSKLENLILTDTLFNVSDDYTVR